MTSVLPDDPYHALGLTKDATAAAIKTAYRKLVLKHHPDKVQDESLKATASDLFHKVQAAWETIGDEDKRTRYDAQARLATLRKEAMDRDRSSRDVRPPPTQSYREEPRSYDFREAPRSSSYRTEEIRPSEPDYFPRRDYDIHERTRHTPPREERRKPTRQDSKEAERARRQEKVRQSTRTTARERDYKYAQVEVESDSDSDRHRRSPPRERYQEPPRRQHEDASRYYDERLHQKASDARDYIERSTRRRPSPTRMSSRDQEFVRGSDGRPVAFRRDSGRPKTSSRDDLDSRPRRREVERSSSELEEPVRRPSIFASSKSAPHDIKLPYEKTRASSVQHTKAEMDSFLPSPVKRADSMPLQVPHRSKPVRQSTLRQTQTTDDNDKRRPTGRSREYADDTEFPTPDGYVVEPRRPSQRTKSPEPYTRQRATSPEQYRSGRASSRENYRRDSSPEHDRSRGYGRREASPEHYSRRAPSPGAPPTSYRSPTSRYPPQSAPVLPPLNTRTTSYKYTPQGLQETMSATRPKLARGDSGRKDSYLYGEVPTTRDSYLPENVKIREVRPDAKIQTGYSTSARRPSESVRQPSYVRGSSFRNTPPMSA